MSPLHLLVKQTAWANRQMFGALRDVPGIDEHPASALIRRALDHIHVVRDIFRAHLEGRPHGYHAPQRSEPPSLAKLDTEFDEIDRWYSGLVDTLTEDELHRARDVRFTDGRVVKMTFAEMLLHVVTHTIHHRGNVDAIMIQTDMPRRRDGIPDYLRSLEA